MTEQELQDRDQKNIQVLSERGEHEMRGYAEAFKSGWTKGAAQVRHTGEIGEPTRDMMEDVLANMIENGNSDALGMLPFGEARRIIKKASKEQCGE